MAEADDIAIKVEHVSKTFKLPHEKSSSIKGALINFRKAKKGYEKQHVLKDVSFEIKKGEFFGIVGRNGSGKSTLLKLLAGIYTPDSGAIHVNGKLTPFIELGVGFNPELTGRENVFLNGALLGFNRKQMLAMYDDIVAFAELERFMDQKLKNYSSGMQVRLAFSIAIQVDTDVLLLDEVLAVGDEAFQQKCQNYFKDLKRNKKTVVLVTHDMSVVEQFCDRAMLIEKGEIVMGGDPVKVAHGYKKLFVDTGPATAQAMAAKDSSDTRWGDHRLKIKSVKSPKGMDLQTNGRIRIGVNVQCQHPVKGPILLAYTVKSRDGKSLFGDSVEIKEIRLDEGESASYVLSFPDILSRGDYFIDLSLREPKARDYIDFWIDCAKFSIKDQDENGLHILVDSKLQTLDR